MFWSANYRKVATWHLLLHTFTLSGSRCSSSFSFSCLFNLPSLTHLCLACVCENHSRQQRLVSLFFVCIFWFALPLMAVSIGPFSMQQRDTQPIFLPFKKSFWNRLVLLSNTTYTEHKYFLFRWRKTQVQYVHEPKRPTVV